MYLSTYRSHYNFFIASLLSFSSRHVPCLAPTSLIFFYLVSCSPNNANISATLRLSSNAVGERNSACAICSAVGLSEFVGEDDVVSGLKGPARMGTGGNLK